MDILEVSFEKSFTFTNGWYVLVIINNERHFYIALEDLDQYLVQGWIVTDFDLELHLNYLLFKIDQALKLRNEALFINHIKQYKKSNDLKVYLENNLHNSIMRLLD